MNELSANDYLGFLVEIKTRIRQAQYQAFRAVNNELLSLYWDLGESIHQKQEVLGWGKSVVQSLANDLQAEFPGRNGFSAQNLWYMRQFYSEYQGQPKLQPLVGEISWAKNLVIMARCKDLLEKEFYLRATARFGWTKAVLQHQIDNQSYAKYLLNQTNFDQTLPPEIKAQAVLAVKDHYTFDFLGLADEHSERELELALVQNLRSFLSEMGGLFTFVGTQHRLEVGGQFRSIGFWKFCTHGVSGHSNGAASSAQGVFNHGFIFIPADDDSNGRVFVRKAFLRVERFEIKLHLAFVLGLERSHFEFNRHQGAQAAMKK